MKGGTPEKNQISVKYVLKCTNPNMNKKFRKRFTLEKSHMNVLCVKSLLHITVHPEIIDEFTQNKSILLQNL